MSHLFNIFRNVMYNRGPKDIVSLRLVLIPKCYNDLMHHIYIYMYISRVSPRVVSVTIIG